MPFSFTSGKWHLTRNPTELLSNPFAKRKVTTKTDNFSKPATDDWMAKAPAGRRTKGPIHKPASFPKRQPVKRTSSKKRKRLAPRGKFRKPKKVRKIATKYHNHRYEVEGTCNAGQAYMYVGLNDCYKRDAIFDAMADALLRPILAKEFKFYPLQDTDTIGDINTLAKSTLVFGWKRVSGLAGVQQVITGLASDADLALCRLDCDNTTYETMRTRMATMLKAWADGNAAVAPNDEIVAFFPCMYHTMTYTGTAYGTAAISLVTSFKHLGETMIDLVFKQTTSFVNRTLAEGGSAAGQDLDRLGTNPLKGKLYQFNNAAPRILDHVDMTAALRSSIQSDPGTGMDKYTSTDAADSHLAHPLSAKFWLKNCSKESSIMLQPGQTKSHSTVYKVKGKISTLIERIYYSGYDKGTFGQSSLFMFDMVHKSDQTPTTTYKRLCIVQSAGKLKTPKLYIPDFEAATEDL
mgnify:CR=1 FL=1